MSQEYGKNSAERPRYYEILCIPHDATPEQIRAAFRKRARETHPDVNPGIDRKEFQMVNEAYQVLSDETKRSQYDRLLRTSEDPSSERPQSPHSSWVYEQRVYRRAPQEYRPAEPDPAVRENLKKHEEAYFQKKQEVSEAYQRNQQQNTQEYKKQKRENEAAFQAANTANEAWCKKEQAACEEMRRQFLRQPGSNASSDNGYFAAKDKVSREYFAKKDRASADYFAANDRIDREYFANKDRIEREYFANKDRIDREYIAVKDSIVRGSYAQS